jgi:hypothetical protein
MRAPYVGKKGSAWTFCAWRTVLWQDRWARNSRRSVSPRLGRRRYVPLSALAVAKTPVAAVRRALPSLSKGVASAELGVMRLFKMSRGQYAAFLPCVINAGTAAVPRVGGSGRRIVILALRDGACRCVDQWHAGPMIPICDDQKQRARACQDMASALLGIEGVTVTEVEEEGDGRLSVWARVAGQVAGPAAFPACAVISERVHEWVVTRPRDIRPGGREICLFLVKRRLECAEAGCPQGTFTEWAPQVPPRCAITRRLLEHAGSEVTERGITPAESARHNGISWPSAHGAFAGQADEILGGELAQVPHLGIDEHRRGRPRWRRDTGTGECVQLADRWHTCFYDLSEN